jgi:RHS repeat-associated protein
VWTKVYDALNRVVSSSDPIASPNTSTTVTVYDDTGQDTGGTLGVPTNKVTDPSGVITLTALDLLGRKTSTKVGSPSPTTWLAATTYEYDLAGNVTKVTDPTGVWTSSTYNAFSEVTKTTAPTGTNGAAKDTSYTYDTAGRLTLVQDANGKQTSYGYDAMGRITSVTPPDLGTGETAWAIVYDSAGERVKVTDPNGRTRSWTYDTLGRLSTYRETRNSGYTCPRSGTNVCLTTYHYSPFGELTSVDDPRASNLTLNFVYDNLSRKTQRYGLSGAQSIDSETYAYDAANNMTQAVSGSTTTNLSYDDAGRSYQVTQGSATTIYTYTKNRLTSRADAAGTTSYGYDSWGRMNSITAPFSGLSNTTYTFDDAGRQLTRTDPSGLVTTRIYDTTSPALSGRLLQETVKLGSTEKAHFIYTYDPVGNVTSLDQSLPSPNTDSGTWSYTYDGQDRMLSAQLGSGPLTTYGYDGDGNRTSVKVGSGSPVTTTYDSSGLPVSASDGTTYSFDAVGNMTSIGVTRTWTFTFDSWNRTKTAAGASNNPSITYSFDALDRMIQRVRNGSTSTYVYSGTTEDPASLTAGGTTTYYAYSPGGPLAQKSGTTVRVYEPNLHGDLSFLANLSGAPTGTASYGPFGDKRSVTGETSYFSFQSDATDSDTGFVDMGTRLYDPQTGRFSTRDSLFGVIKTPLSLNQYVYGTDNPVSLADPDGMCPRDPDNQAGCGYTITSDGGKRYDPSFGKVPLPWTVPPPPIAPPKPIMWVEASSPASFLTDEWRTQEGYRSGGLWDAQFSDSAFLRTLAQAQVNAELSGGGLLGGLGHLLGDAWQAVRFVRNAPITALAVGFAEAASLVTTGHGAGCGFATGLIVVCKNTPGFAKDSFMTWGSAVLGGSNPSADVLRHETKHADQWAILGPDMLWAYPAAAAISLATGGGLFCNNVFERWAGLRDGQYLKSQGGPC